MKKLLEESTDEHARERLMKEVSEAEDNILKKLTEESKDQDNIL